MNHVKIGSRATTMTLTVMLLIGCVAPATTGPPAATPVPPTATAALPTATPIPPTATPTMLAPTATFTPVPPTETPTTVPLIATPTAEPETETPRPEFTLATSGEEIAGTWRAGSYILRFDAYGTLRQAQTLEELDTRPYAICSYRFDRSSMIITEVKVSGVPSCGKKPGKYEVRLLDSGNMSIVAVADPCAPRAGDIVREYEPVSISPTPTPTLEPQAKVIEAWHEAFNNKDVDAFMALVADDAVLDRGPHGLVTGAENIRATVIEEMKEDIRAKVYGFEVEGNRVTYQYEVFTGGSRVDHGMAVAIVENGKITSDLPAE